MTCHGTIQRKVKQELCFHYVGSKSRDESQKGQAKERTQGTIMLKPASVTQLHVMDSHIGASLSLS